MSFKNPKNLIAIVSVIAALTAGTVLLGGYANSKPAEATYDAPIKACQGLGGCCPMMANSAALAKMADTEQTSEKPCTTDCPKPCCADGNADGVCENPCPIPCPKPCCEQDGQKGCCGTSGMTGCPMTATEAPVQ